MCDRWADICKYRSKVGILNLFAVGSLQTTKIQVEFHGGCDQFSERLLIFLSRLIKAESKNIRLIRWRDKSEVISSRLQKVEDFSLS